MSDNVDMILQEPAGEQLTDPAAQAEVMKSLVMLMRGMSDMLASTNATMEAMRRRLDAMERRQQLLEHVTPGQAKAINEALKKQALQLCELYGMSGSAAATKRVAAAIRTDVCNGAGARTVRDLPACDYDVHLQAIELWEDYGKLQAIQEQLRKAGSRHD